MPSFLRSSAFRVALTSCALGFVAWSAWTLRERWQETRVSVEPLTAALAGVAVLASMALMALAWALLMRSLLPSRPPLSRMLSVYATSTLGKYVPGKVGQPVMRMAGVAPYGGSALAVATSMGVEILSWGATGGLVAALLLVLGSAQLGDTLGAYALPVGVLSLAAVVVLATLDHARYPVFVRRLFAAREQGPLLPWSVPLLHLASWTLWAAQGVLLARAVGLADSARASHAAAFFVLAPIAGFLAVPLPAGVGVRESLIVLGLAPSVGAGNALAAALLARGASLAADVILWLLLSRKLPASAAIEAPSPTPDR